MSLWADYYKEIEGLYVYENERGFVMWEVSNDTLHIRELYVVPAWRKQGWGSHLVSVVEDEARARNIKVITTCVRLTQRTKTESLAAQLAYGFEPCGTEADRIYLKLEVSP